MTSSTTATAAGSHIAVCPLPLASHPASLLRLCRKIASSAPNTAQITLFAPTASTPTLSATLSPDEGGKIQIIPIDVGRKDGVSEHPMEAMKVFVDAAGESLRKGIAAAEEKAGGVKVTCLVTDGFMAYACREIAEERGIKWAVMWTSAASGLTAFLHNHKLKQRFGEEGYEAHKEDIVDEYIPGYPPAIRIADLPHEVLAEADTFPIARMLRVMYLHLPTAAAVAVNSFQPLEPGVITTLSRILGDKLFPAGPYALTLQPSIGTAAIQDPNGCLPWLHTRAASSILYISFGTAHMPPPEEFRALAEALEATGVSFLWSLSDRLQSQLPDGFVERTSESGKGKMVPWSPQPAVLAHPAVGAHVTHCGWNSVMDSVLGGVPIICRPFGIADQAFNKRMVEGVWRIGVGVEGGRLTKAGVEAAVERVMNGEEGRGMRERIREMKRLAEEAAAVPDGTSVQNVHKFISIITS